MVFEIIEIDSDCTVYFFSGMVQKKGSRQYVIVNFTAIDSVSVKPFFLSQKIAGDRWSF